MKAALSLRSFEYWLYRYKRTWRGTVASGFLSPVLFLTAIGVGLGGLVDKNATAALGGVSYVAFLAPGLLAATAMQTGAQEASYPVMGSFKWLKTYHAMAVTPLGVDDVLVGHLLWMACRLTLGAASFLCVMAAFGTLRSWEAVFALPAAVLTGMAIAAPLAAFAATQENDSVFAAVFRFLVIPMFLFSGTFFPVRQLPAVLRPVAYLTPLWHGVALSRACTLGRAGLAASVGHVLYLLGIIALGAVIARGTYRRRLVL